MSTEAQQMLDAAFDGTLDLDADASQAPVAPALAVTTETTTTPVEPAAQAASTAQDEEQVGAPIVSKSGTYTIPFEKLSSARQERDQVKAENEQLKAQLAQLNASQARNLEAAQDLAQHRADAGGAPTQADQNLAVAQAAAAQGVDMGLFGSFSEEDIAKGVATLVEQRAGALVDAKLHAALAPLRQREAESVNDAHRDAIYAVHKDADEVYDSVEFKAWVGHQPTYVRAAIQHTLTNGETKDVIEVFSNFKAAHQTSAPAADAVKKALEKAQAQPPTSLSEMTGATSSGATDAERVQSLAGDPAAMLEYMASLSTDKQNRLMNSVV